MANTGNTQQIIDYGASANDGQGDPLRTAFIKTDENFDNIWLAGPVGSNITISNNTVQVNNTNGNLVLSPNGVGVIQVKNAVVPWIGSVYDLGTTNNRWRNAYLSSLSTSYLAVTNDITVGGNLTVSGNIIEMGNVVTDALTVQLANTAANATQANGAGITVGANDDIATFLYDSATDAWTAYPSVSAIGNISGANFSTTGNVEASYLFGNGAYITGLPATYSNTNVANYLPVYSGNLSANNIFANSANISNLAVTNFEITKAGNTWSWDGPLMSTPTGGGWFSDPSYQEETISTGANGYMSFQSLGSGPGINVKSEMHLEHGFIRLGVYNGLGQEWHFHEDGSMDVPGDILPKANGTQSLGNVDFQWANLWVANNTIYIGGVAVGVNAGNQLTVDGAAVVTVAAGNVANVGNFEFNNNALQNPYGGSFDNGSSVTGWTARLSLPAGGGLNPALWENTYGNLIIGAGSSAYITDTWTFDNTGNLTLPSNTASINYANGQPYGGSGGGGASIGNLAVSNVTLSTATPNNPINIETVKTAQPWFYSTYGDLGVGASEEYGESVAHDPGGNVFLLGGNETTGNVFILKMDNGGNLLWQKNLTGANNMRAAQLAIDNTGNIYAAATVLTSNNGYLIKMDNNGGGIWQREIQNAQRFVGLEIDASGNIFCHCRVDVPSPAGTVIKFDSSGSTIWQTLIQCNDVPGAPAGLALDASGNIVVTVYYDVIKLDSSGAALWQVRGNAVGDATNFYNSLAMDPGGNVYLGTTNYNVLKLDPTGSLAWSSNLQPITGFVQAWELAYDPGNDAVIWLNNGGIYPNSDIRIGSLSAASGNTNWNNRFDLVNDDYVWYWDTGTILSLQNNVVAVAGYVYPPASSGDALTLQVPTDGTGQGTYGAAVYSTLPGTVTPIGYTISAGNSTVSTGSLTINPSSYVSITNASETYDNVPMSTSSDYIWTFGADGNLSTAGNLVFTGNSINQIAATSPDASIAVQVNQAFQPWFYSTYGDLGVGTVEEYGESVAHDPGGNVIMAGGNNTNNTVFVYKMDSGGNLLWQKNLTSGNALSTSQMVTDSTGNIYVTAIDQFNIFTYIVKLDNNGDQIWQKVIQDTLTAVGLGADSGGNVLCHVRRNASGISGVIKLDQSGNEIWQKNIFCNDVGLPYGLAVDAGGNVAVTSSYDVIKLDSSGTDVWQVRGNAAGSSNNGWYDVAMDPGGNVYLASGVRSVVKLDAAGSLQWATNIQPIVGETDPWDIAYDPGNDAVIWVNNVPDPTSLYDIILGSLSASAGNTNWNNQFNLVNDFAWYFNTGTILSVQGTVLAVAGFIYPIGASSADALTLQVPANGTGQGTYGTSSYSTWPGSAISQVYTVAPGNSIVSAGNAVISSSTDISIVNASSTYNNVPFIPGGDVAWQFTTVGANGSIVFPDGTTQTTAFNASVNLDFTGNVTLAQATVANLNTSSSTIHLGLGAGSNAQGQNTVAVGVAAGQDAQGQQSVAVGPGAGTTNQGTVSVAMGASTGQNNQGIAAVAIGYFTAQNNQGNYGIAIGEAAGAANQGTFSVAIGSGAGGNVQGNNSVAVGRVAGYNTQGEGATAVGIEAGFSKQGSNSVAIGRSAGYDSQANNSIIINATGVALQNTTANTVVIKPMRGVTGGVPPSGFVQVYYNKTTGELIFLEP